MIYNEAESLLSLSDISHFVPVFFFIYLNIFLFISLYYKEFFFLIIIR